MIKNFLIKILLILVSLIAGMAIIEIWLRVSSPKISKNHKPLYLADEYGNTIHQKNLNDLFYSTEKKSEVKLKTNKEGFIGNDYPLEKGTSTFRIAVLGDSFAEAIQIDTDKNFVSLLENQLNEFDYEKFNNKKIEAMNFGIGGQGTFEELKIYKYYVQKYNPDLVLLVFFPNDFENNQFYINYKKTIFNEERGWEKINISNANNSQTRSDFKYTLLKKSRLIYRLDSIFRSNAFLHNLAVKIGLQHSGPMGTEKNGIHSGFFIYETPLAKSHREVYDFTFELLKHFSKEVNQQTKFAVIYLPEATQADAQLWENKKKSTPGLANYEWNLNQPNTILAEKFKETNTIYFDLTPIYSEYCKKNHRSPIYFNQDGHLNETGHKITAQAIEKFLNEYYFNAKK
ncbi:MAG: SGNH/GDSL hydrolase family protein [bacterium]